MLYDFIIDPDTNKRHRINSTEGKYILKGYMRSLKKKTSGSRKKPKKHNIGPNSKKESSKKESSKNNRSNSKRVSSKSASNEGKKNIKPSDIKVHQVYLNYDGFWCDIFQESTDGWKNTGANYKLWGNKEIATLLNKKAYSKLKKLYYSLKLPIQKVDLIRWVIVYDKGGMYCDLDVVNKSGNLDFIKSDTLITKYKGKYETDIIYFDRPKHPMLEGLFEYLMKNYKEVNKKKIYKEWKGRYVLQTFGPYAIDRFLKNNNLKPKVYKFQTQFQKEVLGKKSGYIRTKKRNSAVVVYKTSSWMTKKNKIDKVRYIPTGKNEKRA